MMFTSCDVFRVTNIMEWDECFSAVVLNVICIDWVSGSAYCAKMRCWLVYMSGELIFMQSG